MDYVMCVTLFVKVPILGMGEVSEWRGRGYVKKG